uniref:Uncharacterized protein n=1 Tax=Callorhinchus milii TaxID=7868 RepID=A0A4W3HL61_CALMI
MFSCPSFQVSEADHCSPDRIFKLVMVGNSGVGKSSFIHRFSHDRFHTEICATIGIDYQVKSLLVGRTQVALQLWDTAGQERFRSVTKQYFRKADGVLVMYDVTTESSFIAVRNWMISTWSKPEPAEWAKLRWQSAADALQSMSERAMA